MDRVVFKSLTLFLFSLFFSNGVIATSSSSNQAYYDDTGFRDGEKQLNQSERIGREIWYKASAGNEIFNTYVFQQRLGVLMDWFRVLRSDEREDRFKAWGLMNDPDCCTPGSEGCKAKSFEETYGFDWCPGDEELLNFVGKNGYKDPACNLQDTSVEDDVHKGQKQNACDLKFGSSTGALGLRKFPNPRFKENQWRKLNGGILGTWEGYNKKLSNNTKLSDANVSHLVDGSIEPPFLVGMACGACHIAFDPTNPPKDETHPKWENLLGSIGNQYGRLSEVVVAGMPPNSIEWQVFSHARPGTVDTSAIPSDQINNPGTMNALQNIIHRPTFKNEEVIKWRKTDRCAAKADEDKCWCEPGRDQKCWIKGLKKETVHHILKSGDDSIGILEALQRVYLNIGSCSEECWVNHLTDLRQLDPQQRGFGQTPVNIGQCRRDCKEFRAIEDRLPDIFNFLASSKGKATNLYIAKKNNLLKTKPNSSYEFDDLIDELENEFGEGSVDKGRIVFVKNCARCHSSTMGKNPDESHDFYKTSEETGLREDFLSNDESILVSEVDTYTCRAMHSNHMDGHVWEEYASETYRAKPGDPNIIQATNGGRGYYRNTNLVSAWAHAPFMHNNAIGPELCGKPDNSRNDFYNSPYVDAEGNSLRNPPECWPYDASIDGRFKLYKSSMKFLLNPKSRIPKITKLDRDIVIDIGPKILDGNQERKIFGLKLVIPKGRSSAMLGNFQHKLFIVDMVQSLTKPKELDKRLTDLLGKAKGKEVIKTLSNIAKQVIKDPRQFLPAVRQKLPLLLDVYSSCSADVENAGHRFGENLAESDKKALIAFVATL